jgi:sugar lactone lactonase YvrE
LRRITLLAAWIAVAATVLAAPLGASSSFPEKIALPDGFRPEGIAIKNHTFYVGSIPTGAIWKGDLRTGEGDYLNRGVASGRSSIGVEYHRGLLFVAGGGTGKGFVYSARTGELLATYTFFTPTGQGQTFVNDVVVARGGAYFTDSIRPFLYRVSGGQVTTIPLSGAIIYGPGNNANGIDKTPNGKTLIIVQTNTGGTNVSKLFTVDRRTGVTREIVLDKPVTNGDGILLDGRRTLYVVENRDNKVAVVKLDKRLTSGTVVTELTDPDFDVPTTIDEFGKRLYAVNARFTTTPTPTTPYWVNQFPKAGKGKHKDKD